MITSGMISSAKDDWETPHGLFAELDAKYHFNLDPCSSDRNAKCEMHYTKADDGLSKSWGVQGIYESTIRQGDLEVGKESI